jgi:hypothetical protein
VHGAKVGLHTAFVPSGHEIPQRSCLGLMCCLTVHTPIPAPAISASSLAKRKWMPP